MSLNRVTLDAEPSTSQNLLQPGAASKKTYEVGSAEAVESSAVLHKYVKCQDCRALLLIHLCMFKADNQS